MTDWNIIWNSFCDEVSHSVKKNSLEIVFEKEIAKDFLQALSWSKLNKGLEEQYPIKFATANHYADFALFVPEKVTPEIIVELKRPKKKKEEKDAKQLIDYMKQKSCSYGVLLLGDKLEVYYIDYSTPSHEASLVEAIKYQHDNDAAGELMDVLNRSTYEPEQMKGYCLKRLSINKSVEYWCSPNGKTEILNMIIERSKLPEPLLDTLRATLHIDVKRKDGLTPIVTPAPVQVEVPATPTSKPKKAKGQQPTNRVWMIPASSKFFDHKACFEELGQIYWKQHFNFRAGDTVYIYYSHPHKRIVFKCEVTASDLSYSEEMNAEVKFYKDPLDFEKSKQHNRYFVLRKTGETSSDALTFKNLLQHGMNGAPMGALNLSHQDYVELRKYIEENF